MEEQVYAFQIKKIFGGRSGSMSIGWNFGSSYGELKSWLKHKIRLPLSRLNFRSSFQNSLLLSVEQVDVQNFYAIDFYSILKFYHFKHNPLLTSCSILDDNSINASEQLN